jgi:hypothetical protein
VIAKSFEKVLRTLSRKRLRPELIYRMETLRDIRSTDTARDSPVTGHHGGGRGLPRLEAILTTMPGGCGRV